VFVIFKLGFIHRVPFEFVLENVLRAPLLNSEALCIVDGAPNMLGGVAVAAATVAGGW
jgi:hypothetical protein